MAIEGLSIRLYFDHNVNPRVATNLRRRGFDVITAQDVGNERASDEAHLRWASDHGRVLVTFDVDDFPVIARGWYFADQSHAGIILSVPLDRLGHGEFLKRLLELLDAITADEMVNRVDWLDERWSPDASTHIQRR